MAEPPDRRGQRLRGRSFVGEALHGSSFAGADLRAADFTRASLVGADLRGARLGVAPAISLVLLALAAVVVSAAGWVTGFTLGDLIDEVRSEQWERVFGGTLAAGVILVFIVVAIVAGLRAALLVVGMLFAVALGVHYLLLAFTSGEFDIGRDLRAISLLALLGASMVAAALARVVGGTFGPVGIVAVGIVGGYAAGQSGGGVAALAVGVLLVALAHRAAQFDHRDRLMNDFVRRLMSRHSTRFVEADLTGADVSGTRIAYCDTTGTNFTGIVFDRGLDLHGSSTRT